MSALTALAVITRSSQKKGKGGLNLLIFVLVTDTVLDVVVAKLVDLLRVLEFDFVTAVVKELLKGILDVCQLDSERDYQSVGYFDEPCCSCSCHNHAPPFDFFQSPTSCILRVLLL